MAFGDNMNNLTDNIIGDSPLLSKIKSLFGTQQVQQAQQAAPPQIPNGGLVPWINIPGPVDPSQQNGGGGGGLSLGGIIKGITSLFGGG